ncbi:MAG: hypothetical protein AVDCRST_MAG27-2669, partial [uncultured Craurococcus sp.]
EDASFGTARDRPGRRRPAGPRPACPAAARPRPRRHVRPPRRQWRRPHHPGGGLVLRPGPLRRGRPQQGRCPGAGGGDHRPPHAAPGLGRRSAAPAAARDRPDAGPHGGDDVPRRGRQPRRPRHPRRDSPDSRGPVPRRRRQWRQRHHPRRAARPPAPPRPRPRPRPALRWPASRWPASRPAGGPVSRTSAL